MIAFNDITVSKKILLYCSEYLRSIGDIPENTDKLFVVSKNNNFIGELKVSKIISSNRAKSIRCYE